MALVTVKELNDWKKTFKVGDKVKVTGENKYKYKEGIITKKTSYVFVDLDGLIIGFRSGLSVIEPAIKVKKMIEIYFNKYKVGDWIETPRKLRNIFKITSEACRVYRTTDKSYWVEIPFIKNYPEGISSGTYAESYFNNVEGHINYSEYPHDENWTIPYNSNEKDFEFLKVKNAFRAPDPLNYRYNLIDDKNEQGYKHSYVMR